MDLVPAHFVHVWPESRGTFGSPKGERPEAVPYADVVLLHEDRVIVGRGTCDAEGRAPIGPLPPGDYVALARAPGERGWGPVPLRTWRSHQVIVPLRSTAPLPFHLGRFAVEELALLEDLEVRVDTPVPGLFDARRGRKDPFASVRRLGGGFLQIVDLDLARRSSLFLTSSDWRFLQADDRGGLPLPAPASFGPSRVVPSAIHRWPLPDAEESSWKEGIELRVVEDPSGTLEPRGIVTKEGIAFRGRTAKFRGRAIVLAPGWRLLALEGGGRPARALTTRERRVILER